MLEWERGSTAEGARFYSEATRNTSVFILTWAILIFQEALGDLGIPLLL